ncbi:hypothetical protein K1719_046698 [Acacia pycnantha]|nr:hypothetical protein K1719_046698 [Acacia pycnantha]
MSKKLAKGKQKSGIATSMLKTLDRMANAAESHNAAEAVEMSQTSEINGHFSIPDGNEKCVHHPPEGKYYVVDAGYSNMKGYLAPFKGERKSGVDDEEFDKCDLNPDYIPEGQEECDIDEEMTIHSPRRLKIMVI